MESSGGSFTAAPLYQHDIQYCWTFILNPVLKASNLPKPFPFCALNTGHSCATKGSQWPQSWWPIWSPAPKAWYRCLYHYLKWRGHFENKSPAQLMPQQPPACLRDPVRLAQSLPQPFFPTSGREQNGNKYLDNHIKFLRCNLSPGFTESFGGTNKNLGGWWYSVICILSRQSLSNSKFMQSPPMLEFEQLCFTSTSNIQQSSNHSGPQSSCLVIHKAIASILKRIYIDCLFSSLLLSSN